MLMSVLEKDVAATATANWQSFGAESEKRKQGSDKAVRAGAEDAFEERKSMARKLGEEAGTKMLFPMILMLGAVMLILAFPAMRSMEL